MENDGFQEDGGQYYRDVENEARHRSLVNGDKKQNSYDTPDVIIEQVKLKKSVGLISGTSLIVGTIIGSGIFISPTDVLDRTGSVGLSLVIWSLSGILALLVTIALINSYDTRWAARVQVFFTGAKLVALLIISIGGLVRLGQGHILELQDAFKGSTTNPSSIALAFYNALWAYDGWNNLNYVTEEIEDPIKNLPRANILAVMLVTIVYIFTNISYLTAMTAAEMLTVDAVAVTWGDRVLAGAAIIMPLSVLFSTFGAANGTLFSGGRVVYVASREGHLPEALSYVHCKRITPLPSIVFTATISIAMVIPGNLGSLIDFFSFTAWLFYGLTVGSLIVLRFTRKDMVRPLKIPIVIPVVFVIIACYLVIGPIVQDPKIEFLYAFLFVIGGLVFYIPFICFKIELRCFSKITEWIQLLCEIVPSPYEPED